MIIARGISRQLAPDGTPSLVRAIRFIFTHAEMRSMLAGDAMELSADDTNIPLQVTFVATRDNEAASQMLSAAYPHAHADASPEQVQEFNGHLSRFLGEQS